MTETAQKLHAALTSQNGLPPHVEFYCDHTQWLRHIEGNLYEDIRPVDRGGQITRRFDHLCGNGAQSPVAFTTSFNPQSPTPNDVITFCPGGLDSWATDWTLRRLQQSDFGDSRVLLDSISQDLMGVSMLHELTHLWTVLDNQRYCKKPGRPCVLYPQHILISTPVDIAYEEGENGRAYGWEAIQTLGREDSRINADSFSYYATGK